MSVPLPPFPELGPESGRLVHGRGGYFEGLEHVAIDWFAPVVLVTLYAAESGNSALIEDLVAIAKAREEVEAVVVQERYLPRAPKQVHYGELPASSLARESGLCYHLDLRRNQNHGFFLDMRAGRDWVRARAEGRRVLNLFAYTCSLSVAAMAGGAHSVTNLDMAGGALSTGRRNHQLNFPQSLCERIHYLPHDLFKSWGRLVRGGPYDLILIDPPSNQGKSFYAEKDYPKILRRLPELLGPKCEILACLNAPHLDESFLDGLFVDYQKQGRLPCAPGYQDRAPAAALKCVVYRHGF